MSHITFSVIIPAFNAEATLKSTVASVLGQSDQDFEIVIVDDGSFDDTMSVMRDLACMDWRIRIVSQPNSGVSAARNFGASLAKGRYLAFLDADDQWNKDKLARHRSLHQLHSLLDASFAKVEFAPVIDGAMATGKSYSQVPHGCLDTDDVVVENAICTTSNFVVSKASFDELEGFDEQLRYAEDQEFFTRLIGNGGHVRGIDQSLVRYRMNEDGLSCDFEEMLEGWRTFARKWLREEALAQAEATYCRYLTRRALRSGADMSVARQLARRGLAADGRSFMAGGPRSILTLGGVVAGGALSASLRRSVFA